ncbi:MAG: IclR family transcriptional regulator [Pseudomonadota bacterium]
MSKGASDGGTVGKALEVLDRVAAWGRPVRFGELLEGSPYPKATLYRFLQTLTREGMLSYDAERQVYAPGIRLVRLAHAAWRQASLAPLARDHLDALSAEVGETVHLAQLDGGQVLYVDKRNAREPLEMFSQAGKVGPAYCTGVGKAMLAYLPDDSLDRVIETQSFHRFTERTLTSAKALKAELAAIRARGHAYDDEEHEPGIICIAMPILSDAGRVLGALSVTTSTMRNSIRGLDKLAPQVRRTAQAISTEAESWTFPDDSRPQDARGAA